MGYDDSLPSIYQKFIMWADYLHSNFVCQVLLIAPIDQSGRERVRGKGGVDEVARY